MKINFQSVNFYCHHIDPKSLDFNLFSLGSMDKINAVLDCK